MLYIWALATRERRSITLSGCIKLQWRVQEVARKTPACIFGTLLDDRSSDDRESHPPTPLSATPIGWPLRSRDVTCNVKGEGEMRTAII